MIEAAGVSLRYPGNVLALKNFDLQVAPGDLVYLTGPSGSGKTSLLKLLMGMEFPTTGSLKVLGQPMTQGRASSIRRLRRAIGPVFQEFRLLKGRTAIDNVMVSLRFLDVPAGQLQERAVSALERVGLRQKAAFLVENLSLGEQQRVAIARAVARQPRLILADEPTGNLDKENASRIMQMLASFRDEKTAVIISTHETGLIQSAPGTSLITIDQGTLEVGRMGLSE